MEGCDKAGAEQQIPVAAIIPEIAVELLKALA
jgi:hypothetical protein